MKINKRRRICLLALIAAMLWQTAFAADYSGLTTAEYDKLGMAEADFGTDYMAEELAVIGVLPYGSFKMEGTVRQKDAADILHRAFLTDVQASPEDDILTNEQFVQLLCEYLGLAPASGSLTRIKGLLDFGKISPKYRPYYESLFAASGMEGGFAHPADALTYRTLIDMLAPFDQVIFEKNGYTVQQKMLTGISLYNGVKTYSFLDGDSVKIDADHRLFTTGIPLGQGVEALLVSKDGCAQIVRGVRLLGEREQLSVSGIYKGSLYLYDKKQGRIIFKDTKRYVNTAFRSLGEQYTVFDVYTNFMLYENTAPILTDNINLELLDREVIFITATDEESEKVVYMRLQ